MRKITSLTLVISGLIELVTSVVLYLIPAGRVAYWSEYHLLGLNKNQWADIHITVGTLLLVIATLHIYYNWSSITAYLKNKAKKITVFNKSFNIALIITLYVTGGTLYNLPPMNYVLQFGDYLTELGNKKYGEPPYGHAELSSLKMFCTKMNIDVGRAVELLKAAGIKITGPEETIAELAHKNGKTPQQLYDIFKPASTGMATEKPIFPDSPAPGFGQKSIKEICQVYDLPLVEVMAALKKAGLNAKEEDTVKEIGAKNQSNPMAIFEILQKIAHGAK